MEAGETSLDWNGDWKRGNEHGFDERLDFYTLRYAPLLVVLKTTWSTQDLALQRERISREFEGCKKIYLVKNIIQYNKDMLLL